MKSTDAHSRPLLPPPVETILFYAAYGLSVRKKRFAPSGRPRLGERVTWVPGFREGLNSREGLTTLKTLAAEGMRAWGLSQDVVGCLDAAFCDITFAARAVAALDDLADTARERFALPTGRAGSPPHSAHAGADPIPTQKTPTAKPEPNPPPPRKPTRPRRPPSWGPR